MEEINNKYIEISAEDFILSLLHNKKLSNFSIKEKVVFSNNMMPGRVKLEISNCIFLDEVDLVTDYIDKVLFIKCSFKKRLLLSGIQYKEIKIIQCEFHVHLAFKRVISQRIEIDECIIENPILTYLQEFSCDYFLFTKNSCNSDILIKPDKIEKSVVIEGCEKNYLITYSGLDISHPVEQLFLFTYSNYRTDYLIRSFKANKLQIIGELKDSILSINNCEINQGIIQHFINQGTLLFNNIKCLSDKSVLVIKDCLLGKAQINNTDFTTFKKVIFSSSNILELVPVNIQWCNDSKLESKDIPSLKENYRQLKIVATKNDDLEAKLFFHRLEMKTLMQLHKLNKTKYNDRIILKTNYLSNDFGLSWTKALYWLIGVSIVCYSIIKILIGEVYFNPSLIPDEIGKYLIFINPIHQFDKVFNLNPLTQNTNGALIFDGISKIFGAYIIYQFVASFRKYSQK